MRAVCCSRDILDIVVINLFKSRFIVNPQSYFIVTEKKKVKCTIGICVFVIPLNLDKSEIWIE